MQQAIFRPVPCAAIPCLAAALGIVPAVLNLAGMVFDGCSLPHALCPLQQVILCFQPMNLQQAIIHSTSLCGDPQAYLCRTDLLNASKWLVGVELAMLFIGVNSLSCPHTASLSTSLPAPFQAGLVLGLGALLEG